MSEQRVEWSPGEMIGRAWEKVKADPVGVVLPVFVVGVIQGLPGGILGQIAGALGTQAQKDNDATLAALALALQAVGQIVTLLLAAYLTGGLLTFLLKVVRGQTYSFADVFSGGRYFGPMLLTLFLVGLGVSVGLMLCIIPGVILALGWSLAALLVVDRNLSATDAIGESWRLTTGHKGNLFLYGLLSIGVVLLGLLVCCVGVIPAQAVVALGQVFIYERLTSARPAPDVLR